MVEFLVVIVVLLLLLAVLLPAVQYVRESSRRESCVNNQKQIGLALLQYETVSKRFPPARTQHPANIFPDYFGQPDPPAETPPLYTISWLARILPYTEQQALYVHIRPDDSSLPHPSGGLPGGGYINGVIIPLYHCPSGPGPSTVSVGGSGPSDPAYEAAHTHYLGVNGTDQFSYDGMLYVNSQVTMAHVTDGVSNTLFVGERPPAFEGYAGWWFAGNFMYPWFGAVEVVLGSNERIVNANWECRPGNPQSWYRDGRYESDEESAWHFWSMHPRGANFLFVDGSVRQIPYNVDQTVFRSLATRSGGEAINGDY